MIEWPDGVVNDLARRRAILVIGSGISRHAVGQDGVRPPTWRQFLEQAMVDCPDKRDLDPVSQAIAGYRRKRLPSCL